MSGETQFLDGIEAERERVKRSLIVHFGDRMRITDPALITDIDSVLRNLSSDMRAQWNVIEDQRRQAEQVRQVIEQTLVLLVMVEGIYGSHSEKRGMIKLISDFLRVQTGADLQSGVPITNVNDIPF